MTYRGLLGDRRVRATLAWSIVGRLPLSMLPLGLLLLTRATGAGYGASAAVAAGYSLALAVTTPAAGLSVDRRGLARALLPRAGAFAAVSAATCACAAAGGPVALLGALAVLMGMATPPVTAATRASWQTVAPDASGLAMSLDASAHEVVFIIGPAIVAVVAGFSPVSAIAVAVAAGAIGTVGFVAASARPEHGGDAARLGTALTGRGMRTLLAGGLLMGVAVGAVEAAMPPFAEQHGQRALSGVAIACFAAGSGLGAILAGRLADDARRRLLVAAALTPVALTLPLAAGSIASMCVCIAAAGLPLAAALSGAYTLVAALAPRAAQTEAFGWMTTALYAGGAGGTALAGQLVASGGPARALEAAAAAGLGCGAAAWLGRDSLRTTAPLLVR